MFGARFPHDVLDLFESLVDVSASCFYLVSEDQRAFGHVLNKMSYETLPNYNRTYEKLDPFHPRRFVRSEARIVTQSGPQQAVLESSIYYREFMSPQNLHYEAEIFFRSEGRILAGVSLHRSKAHGPFLPDEIELLQKTSTFVEKMVRAYHPTVLSAFRPDAEDTRLFTSREKDIIALVRAGHTNEDIGRKLGIRLPTVKTHLHNIFRKADVTSRTGLVSRGNLY